MMQSLRAGHLLIALSLLLLAVAPQARAQFVAVEDDEKAARKFDEFAEVYGCDHGARLSNFAIQLQNEPDAVGYVICYGPESDGSGSASHRLNLTKDYLVMSHGIDPARIRTISGGRYKDLRMSATEFWIASPGAEPPEPQKYENEAETFSGKFTERYFNDSTQYDESTGPSIGDVTLAGFADVLRRQPDARAYLVAYSLEGAAPGAWRRAAKDFSDRLVNGYKIPSDRIVILRGGYRPQGEYEAAAQVELWVLPANAPPPVAETTEPEQRPKSATLVGRYSDYDLEVARSARLVLEGFADVLKGDEELRACVIIRPRAETEEQADQDKRWGMTRADLNALVERWPSELEEKYGIERNRLVVIVAPVEPTEEYQPADGTLETWLVPPGAQLPDPNAIEEETVDPEAVITDEEMAEQATTEEVGKEPAEVPPEE